jgi:hypothetical protein
LQKGKDKAKDENKKISLLYVEGDEKSKSMLLRILREFLLTHKLRSLNGYIGKNKKCIYSSDEMKVT